MIQINEIRKGEIWVHVNESTDFLDGKTGARILGEIDKIPGGNNITIDLQDIRSISGEGFNVLYTIMQKAKTNDSNIYFTNVHKDIDELISILTETSEG